jgi:formylglycine-generating enzyme required for sulfatase activity
MPEQPVTECIPEGGPSPGDGMRWVPGGTFRMGDDNAYPEEAPAYKVAVSGFWIDEYLVTNANFAAFVAATDTAPSPNARSIQPTIPGRILGSSPPAALCSSCRLAPRI